MANVKVTIIEPKGFIKRQLSIIKDLSDRQANEIANESAQVMRDNITSSIQREGSTGTLANAMQVEKTSDGYGVGNINSLNQHVKQWYWLNFGVAQTGRTTPPGTDENPNIKGHFEPDNNGRFVKGSPRFVMNPKKPITAINYIEKTVQNIPSIILNVFNNVRSK